MTRLLSVALLVLAGQGLLAANEWPQFRGPGGEGHAASRKLPLTWTETENVVWQIPLPGTGWSSPVIGDDTLWMATATEDGHSLRALCVDRQSGALRHDIELFRVAAPEPIHELNSHASPTPVIGGNRVYFFFGMYGAAALDRKTGGVLWKNTDLPHDHGKNGPGSSPILHRNLLVLNCDGTTNRFVTALDAATGRPVWRTERSNRAAMEGKAGDFKKAYHTPTVIRVGDRDELISMGAYRLGGYDPATGRELWWVDIPGFSNVTRPVHGHGLIYLATGFMKPEFWAIRPGGSGDVSGTHVAWKVTRQAPQKPSPALVGDEVYMVSDNGIVTCMDAVTGRIHYSERLGGEFSASPLVAGDRIYCFDQKGKTTVLGAGKTFRILGESQLGDGFMATPAVAGDSLFLRSKTRLYRVEARVAARR